MDKLYRRSNSQGTVDSVLKGLAAFEQFALERYPALRGLHVEYPYADGVVKAVRDQELDALKLLDAFSAHLSRKTILLPDGTEAPLKPHTVHNLVFAVVGLFRFHDVQVPREMFKEKVTLPKASEIEDRPVKAEQLRLLYSCAGPVTRALLLVLTSSGMRIGEASQVRVRDIDFETAKPAAVVHLRAETTKTDMARDVFISDEAVQAVQAVLTLRKKQPDDLLFFPGKTSDPKRLRRYYNKLLVSVGRGHPEVLERVEGHSYYNLHLHNAGRKWFFSKVVGAVGETAAHALMGHSFYLKTYYRRSLDERAADYLRAMPLVSFLKGPGGSAGKHFSVRTVSKKDEPAVLRLLEDGYVYTQDLNGKAVYKKEAAW
ncbi:MAG: site-specific integrase [Thaumarchaeota archaeon]|nr:site-specific integrase [Nitrososphaerota archaeon]